MINDNDRFNTLTAVRGTSDRRGGQYQNYINIVNINSNQLLNNTIVTVIE